MFNFLIGKGQKISLMYQVVYKEAQEDAQNGKQNNPPSPSLKKEKKSM